MEVLQHDELMDYLKKAIEVETDVAIQEKMIEEYEKEAEKRKPVLSLREIQYPDLSEPCIGNERLVYISCGLIGVILLFFQVMTMLVDGTFDSVTMVILGLMFCISLAVVVIPYRKYLNEMKAYRSAWASYNIQAEKLDKENKEKQAQHDAAMLSWKHAYNENKNALDSPLKQTKEIMDQFYAKDVIYPKYRNLPALTSICEYFITGRCTELTGPHGAYNLYEDEVRKDMVISQLSMVIENLESIKNNQYMLYQQVKSIRENTDAMTQELRMIKGYTFNIMQTSAITAYYSQITAKYTRRDYWFNN